MRTILVDAGIMGPPLVEPDVTREEVGAAAGADVEALRAAGDRGQAVLAMARGATAVVERLYAEGRCDGVLAAGGSGNTSIAAEAMRALPVGVPKLIVSTIAAGDTRPIVGASDMLLAASVVDVAGINSVSARILANAAAAMAGMVQAAPLELGESRPLIAASMFGVTTPCVTHAAEVLDGLGYEVLTFHMTGTGGRSMEALIEGGFIAGVLDATTTELCDELVGGVLSAGPDRLTAAGRAGVPQVVSLGALDMVNFGPRETVPAVVRGPQHLRAQCAGDADAHDPRRVRQAGGGGRAQALGLDGAGRAVHPARRHLHDRDARRAVLRRRGRRGAVRGRARELRAQRGADRARERHQRPGLRRGHGRQAARLPRRCRVKRAEALARLQATIASGRAVIGAGAGTGLSAKCAEAGGVDLIIIYNSGRYRMAGRGSLSGLMPYGDANEIVVDMAREVLPVVKEVPVLAGVCGTDPFRLMDVFMDELTRIGFSGVQNFPTVGLLDGLFRINLEETGMGYDLEVDAIRIAREKDLLTAPYVFDVESAVAMTQAGADVLVPHMGLTTKGTIGASTAKTLDECVVLVQEMHDAAVAIRPEVIVLCHGGPIAEPDDARYVLERTHGVKGFFGASSMERLPTEIAMTENMRRFKNLTFNP